MGEDALSRPLPPFEPSGDLPEDLSQAEVTELFARFGRGTLRREAPGI